MLTPISDARTSWHTFRFIVDLGGGFAKRGHWLPPGKFEWGGECNNDFDSFVPKLRRNSRFNHPSLLPTTLTEWCNYHQLMETSHEIVVSMKNIVRGMRSFENNVPTNFWALLILSVPRPPGSRKSTTIAKAVLICLDSRFDIMNKIWEKQKFCIITNWPSSCYHNLAPCQNKITS